MGRIQDISDVSEFTEEEKSETNAIFENEEEEVPVHPQVPVPNYQMLRMGMVHPDNISRELVHSVDVSPNVEGIVVKAVDGGGDFNNKQEFDDRESMLTWIRRNATDLGFGAVIGRSDNGTARRNAFVTMLCERSGKYHPPPRKFKRDEAGTRKCEFPFKIRDYMLASKKWRFNLICGLHNHDMCGKLQGHPSVCRLNPEENTCINDMSLNLFQPKNILSTLKRKKPNNVSNIRQVYNIWYRNNKAIRGDRSEVQQLLKMLDDNKYVSWYRTCDDGVLHPPIKQVEMPKAIVTNGDTALMNAVAKIFPSSNALLCRYHITCNVKSKVKSALGTKQVETNGGKSVKPGVIVEQIMDAWTLLEHRLWDNILYFQLIGNVSRARLNYIFHEAKQGENVSSGSVKCGCTITIMYGLPCACVIAKKERLGEPIRMDEVIPHWKRLSFDDDDGCVEGEKSNISITSELEAIQEMFSKADDNTKLHIK
ncbi:uncharacterized protein LOC131618923 [Vicia villosa]|uniref:uncharacterized protein LOC131618923 n=1 Tax=Vicia villosa TaxID=3911 RepID=UPI00273C5691|nr:uncharacterized protein LOC131618923 [Vicia villosa]